MIQTKIHFLVLIGVLFLFSVNIFAQNIAEDIAIVGKEFKPKVPDQDRIVSFPESTKKSFFAKYNPVSLVFRSLLFGYQKYVSVQLFAECLFSPSCSDYSKQLIYDHGLIWGVMGSADRLSRCNPLSEKDVPKWKYNKHNGKIDETTDIYKIKP